mgnify:CR=1 FL=1
MKAMFVVFLKEVLENLRDRRTVTNALVMGPLLGPLLFTGLTSVMIQRELDKGEKPLEVPLIGSENAPNLVEFLKQHGVRHVLLTGYATDMCFCRTTAGYENLSRDFNVFLVGDATLATFPANSTPRYATNAHISFASLNHLITQVSWIKPLK